MNRKMKAFLPFALVSSFVCVQAQSAPPAGNPSGHSAKTAKKRVDQKPQPPSVQQQLQALEAEFLARDEQMQAQIDDLKAKLAARDLQLNQAEQTTQAAKAAAETSSIKANVATSKVGETIQTVATLLGTVSDLKASNLQLQDNQQALHGEITDAVEAPKAIRYKGVDITPISFIAAETVYRTRSLNADINTPFNAVPFPGAAQANVSEFNATGRQSRLGLLFQGKMASVDIGGYFEADFLSAGTSSNSNESNSYSLRYRQAWAQGAWKNGFTLTGGQMWSLVSETKHSTDPRTENMPMTIDAQYHVGFSWARQYGMRLSKTLADNKVTIAVSAEEAQGLYAGANAPPNFFIGNAGSPGGLLNPTTNYTNNLSPDFVVKAAFDPGYGHYEVIGLVRLFRDRYYPNQSAKPASAAGGTNATVLGGGFGFNARFPVTAKMDAGVHVLTGDGIGRYGSTTLPDFTVHPSGTPEPIRATQFLLTLEPHPTSKLDLYINSGVEYAQRTTYLNSRGVLEGYAPPTLVNTGCGVETLPASTGNGFSGGPPYNPGVPANCQAVTRAMFETTVGEWYRLYKSEKGMLRFGLQYSHLGRYSWAGIGGAPRGTDNMIFTSFRYYLP